MINNFIATVIEKNLPNKPLLHVKALTRYINTAIFIEFVYPSRKPAIYIGQWRHYLRPISYRMKRI